MRKRSRERDGESYAMKQEVVYNERRKQGEENDYKIKMGRRWTRKGCESINGRCGGEWLTE